ncbi:MAG: hypothetical protein AB1505_02855 [Candidatus Latescibacterota bacterium]
MLSLTVLSSRGDAVHARLEGNLTHADVSLLQQFGQACRQQGAREMWLHVDDLWNIDALAVQALRALPGQGLRVRLCAPGAFLRQLLMKCQLEDWIAEEPPCQ